MKAPRFWWQPPGLAAACLRPASLAYGAVAARRLRVAGSRAPVPVICIGNMTVGGSGKTPTAIHVATMLRNMGRSPAFLTRGYRGKLSGPIRVDPAVHDHLDVGDEALLLARVAPTIVARFRPAGAAMAARLGADAVVMDDGLQNPSLLKDISLVVFDGAVGVGNGLTLPAGPLRAPLTAQWPIVDAVLIVGEGRPGEAIAQEAHRRGLPVLHGVLRPDGRAAAALAGQRVLAFAGIGRPEKFFATLRGCGAELVETRSFPDHHRYRADEIRRLLDAAEAAGLMPVTTEKDSVRLATLAPADARLGTIATLPVSLTLAEPHRLIQLLQERLLGR